MAHGNRAHLVDYERLLMPKQEILKNLWELRAEMGGAFPVDIREWNQKFLTTMIAIVEHLPDDIPE